MKYLYLFLSAFFSSAGWAEEVIVRSGEHIGFTRVVLITKDSMQWAPHRTEDGYDFDPDSPKIEYDLTQAFASIGRDRLVDLLEKNDKTGIHMKLACECRIAPYQLRRGIFVVDIHDAASNDSKEIGDLGNYFRQELAPVKAKSNLLHVTNDAIYDWLESGDHGLFAPSTQHTVIAKLPAPTPAVEPRIDFLEALTIAPANSGIKLSLPDRGFAAGLASIPSENIALNYDRNYEMDHRTESDTPADTDVGKCITNDELDIAGWQIAGPVSDVMVDLKQNLIEEFDNASPQDVMLNVRYLIYLGFGAEARQIINTYGSKSTDVEVLVALSHLIDSEVDPKNVFAKMVHCETSAALWAFLSSPEITSQDATNVNAITRTFSALPAHHRRNIGSALIEKFLSLRMIDTAKLLHMALRRSQIKFSNSIELSAALISLSEEKTALAMAGFKNLLGGSDLTTPQAYISFAKIGIKNSDILDAKVSDSISALSYEMKGTSYEAPLLEAKYLALAASGNFKEAMTYDFSSPDITDALLNRLVKHADDATFLQYAVINQGDRLPKLPYDTAWLIGKRLDGLGFPREAMLWRITSNSEKGFHPRDVFSSEDVIAIMAHESPDAFRFDSNSRYNGVNSSNTTDKIQAESENKTLLNQIEGRNDLNPKAGNSKIWPNDRGALSPGLTSTISKSTIDLKNAVTTISGSQSILTQSQNARKALGALLLKSPR